MEAIQLPEDWGVFFLGCQHLQRPEVVGPGLVRATYPVDHHAIGINAKYFDRILRTWRVWSGKAGHDGTATEVARTNSDVELARLAREIPMYACYPNLAWQRKDVSDQTGRFYSNYTPEGDQLHCRDVVAGLGAEVLGAKRWQGLPLANQSHGRWDDAERTGLLDHGTGIREFLRGLEERSTGLWPVSMGEREKAAETVDAGAGGLAGGSGCGEGLTGQRPVLRWRPRLGVLLLTRGAVLHEPVWGEFLSGLTEGGGRVFAHAKEREAVPEGWHREALIPAVVETAWGGIGLTRAMLALLRAALEVPVAEGGLSHFFFASESCVPILPAAEMQRRLAVDGRSWLKVQDLNELWKVNAPKAKRILAEPLPGRRPGFGGMARHCHPRERNGEPHASRGLPVSAAGPL